MKTYANDTYEPSHDATGNAIGIAAYCKTAADHRSELFAIIDGRRLERECFIRSIQLLHPQLVFLGYSSIDDCLNACGSTPDPDAIIINIGSRTAAEPDMAAELRRLVERAPNSPVVVLAETEDLNQMIAVIDCGARGYIPASVGIDTIVEATKLTSLGGIFLTAGSLASLRSSIRSGDPAPLDFTTQLTSRQSVVADALRRGKANKIIAYELSMCESTVKVHIRNILKKLKASNRTEAAFKLNAICSDRSSHAERPARMC